MADNALALSDEEFANLPIPEANGATEHIEQETPPPDDSEEPPEPEDAAGEVEADEDPPKESEAPVEPDGEVVASSDTPSAESAVEVNYKEKYEEIFKPFKANGKDITVESIDDVRQLMQMGANYNKKMAGLKPNLKLIKMLENNDLLDEAKISYLIDLNKHNPDAVKKLIKDSGLDPLEVDINQEVSYKANTYAVNDRELELEAVLSEIKETDSFNTTIDIIGNKWDDGSKRVLLEHPNVIKVINEHVNNGVYQTITTEVEKLRMLGKLEGLNDIDAYKAVGDALYTPRANPPLGNIINTSASKATNRENPRIVEKRKAASATKTVASSSNSASFNPLSMSDEEFEKIASSKYI